MDEAEAIARADRLWEAGRRAPALESLRARIRRSPADEDVRRRLVARYRELGALDQAGRYGLAIAGLTTARERDLAARQFAASRAGTSALREHLALPDGALPSEVLDLVVEVERRREERRLAWQAAHSGTPGDYDDDLTFAVWAVAGTLLVLSLLAAVVADLAGAPWTALARWAAVVVVTAMVVGSVVEWRRAVAVQRSAAVESWGSAAIVLAFGLVGLVCAAVVVS
ncbi:hypothetical protein MT344_09625 [Clavibacter michiganensis subsp. phaseoli]|uniref:DUF6584 family protein n=1 Tax=Clavibacter phaseoli TaxID=1734031 RepID=UPI001FB48123|nr:DUF6584 family protein [Clavibacter phaseoli]MCJ1711437.1 hypothetical protein [Clavibacter phaseoli]